MQVTDWRGTPIEEGSIILYGAGEQMRIYITEARVDRIYIRQKLIEERHRFPFHLKVTPLRRSVENRSVQNGGGPRRMTPVRLQSMERVTVIG